MEGVVIHKKRLTTELKILTMDPDVQSYFYYENSGPDQELKCFVIYGYLLPRTKPYKYGAYRVRIIINSEFPFTPPVLDLLTCIYHPAINNDSLQPKFCRCSHRMVWTVGTRISQWIEQFVNIIDQPDTSYAYGMYCISNPEAESLYLENREEYDRKAGAMVLKYAYRRPYRSIVSLQNLDQTNNL
jgi:ubiquitin-protein ligase